MIYRTNRWEGNESISGRGSDLDQTEVVRKELPKIIEELSVMVMLDAPCGDLNWINETKLDLKQYIGADIVPELIDANRRRYGCANKEFIVLDITKDKLPKVDLIVCRDCLVHLSSNQVMSALRNFRSSGSSYLLTTTFTNSSVNVNIPTGKWRPINLQASPFHLPEPIKLIDENCSQQDHVRIYSDKHLGLWKLEDLPL
jgi:hypothetical protein